MKTRKHFVLVICGVLHFVISVITMTRLPQYEIVVMVINYSNPSHSARRETGYSCRGSNCSCCDGHRESGGYGNCSDGCDSRFEYCLRKIDTLDGRGCPGGGTILRSHTNYDDTSIDFSQNTVLGLDNPLVFQGLGDTWKGVQLYVKIQDFDHDQTQISLELIDEVKWNITQGVGVPSGVVNLIGMYGIVAMKVNITVLCVPGFNGTMCEGNIDDCVGASCRGNTQCVDGVNSFTCNCIPGFTGTLCNEIDECVNVTCSGRGQCVDGVASYVCDCDAGYTGGNCETNINDCLLDPCGIGGQCVDGVNSFICVCIPGFTGVLCQINVDECAGVSCSGNGQCVDGVNSFTCNCTSGFTGALCTKTDECVNVNCSERGQCVDGVTSYVCDCDAGYTGKNCEMNISNCLSNLCGEQGQCVDGVNSFICTCLPGFTGEFCQVNIDDCMGVNCSGNGECVDEVNAFTCECSSGYKGLLCAEVSGGRQSIPVIPIVCGAAGALFLILILTLLVIITLKCTSKCCSKLVNKSDNSAMSKTQNEPIEMKENEVYGVSIAALEPERSPQESVLMSKNICYVTIQDFKS